MILIPYGTIFHTVEHLTKPKRFHISCLLYYLFDEKVLYYDRKSHRPIKSLQEGPLQRKPDKSFCACRNLKDQNTENGTLCVNVFQPLHPQYKPITEN